MKLFFSLSCALPVLALLTLGACGNSDDSSGETAGSAGAAGPAGASGAALGGSAGTSAPGGSAGTSGTAGHAGQASAGTAGTAGSSGGAGGTAGQGAAGAGTAGGGAAGAGQGGGGAGQGGAGMSGGSGQGGAGQSGAGQSGAGQGGAGDSGSAGQGGAGQGGAGQGGAGDGGGAGQGGAGDGGSAGQGDAGDGGSAGQGDAGTSGASGQGGAGEAGAGGQGGGSLVTDGLVWKTESYGTIKTGTIPTYPDADIVLNWPNEILDATFWGQAETALQPSFVNLGAKSYLEFDKIHKQALRMNYGGDAFIPYKDGFTYLVVIDPLSLSSYAPLWDCSNSVDAPDLGSLQNRVFFGFDQATSALNYTVFNAEGVPATTVISPPLDVVGKWAVLGLRHGADNNVWLTVNGTIAASATAPLPPVTKRNHCHLGMSVIPSTPGNDPLDAAVGAVFAYNRGLSLDELGAVAEYAKAKWF